MPRWIKIVSILIALLALVVGLLLYQWPGKFIEGVDFAVKQNRFLAAMWAARQVAVALVMAYSIYRSSTSMLRATLLVYCIINLQDLAIGVYMRNIDLAAGALFFTALSAGMIIRLSRTHIN